jgi:hypothetical protein
VKGIGTVNCHPEFVIPRKRDLRKRCFFGLGMTGPNLQLPGWHVVWRNESLGMDADHARGGPTNAPTILPGWFL